MLLFNWSNGGELKKIPCSFHGFQFYKGYFKVPKLFKLFSGLILQGFYKIYGDHTCSPQNRTLLLTEDFSRNHRLPHQYTQF